MDTEQDYKEKGINDDCLTCSEKGIPKDQQMTGNYLLCDKCHYWNHSKCQGTLAKGYFGKGRKRNSKFICSKCSEVKDSQETQIHSDLENIADSNEAETQILEKQFDQMTTEPFLFEDVPPGSPARSSQTLRSPRFPLSPRKAGISLSQSSNQSSINTQLDFNPSNLQQALNSIPENSLRQSHSPSFENHDDPEQDSDAELDETDYKVEKIVAHGRYDDGSIGYRTRWVGYNASEDTWLKEDAFVSAYTVLAKYKRANKLGLPTIEKKFGARNDRASINNPENWVTASKIMEVVLGYTRKEYRDSIQIKYIDEPSKLGTQDYIILLDAYPHIVAGVYYASKNLAYIADGDNAFIEDKETRTKIRRLIDVPVKAVPFIKQNKVDYCASSAVAICVKFYQLYATAQDIPPILEVAKFVHGNVKKTLHSAKSESLKSWEPVNNRKVAFKCDFPDCKTVKKDQKSMASHKRLAHGNNPKSN